MDDESDKVLLNVLLTVPLVDAGVREVARWYDEFLEPPRGRRWPWLPAGDPWSGPYPVRIRDTHFELPHFKLPPIEWVEAEAVRYEDLGEPALLAWAALRLPERLAASYPKARLDEQKDEACRLCPSGSEPPRLLSRRPARRAVRSALSPQSLHPLDGVHAA